MLIVIPQVFGVDTTKLFAELDDTVGLVVAPPPEICNIGTSRVSDTAKYPTSGIRLTAPDGLLKVSPVPVAVDTTTLFEEVVDSIGVDVEPFPESSKVGICRLADTARYPDSGIKVAFPSGLLIVKPEFEVVDTTRLFAEFVDIDGVDVAPLPTTIYVGDVILETPEPDPLNNPFREFAFWGESMVLSLIVFNCLGKNLNNQNLTYYIL